jgi:hypothetical protein
MDLDTRHRTRATVLQFVRRERGDSSFLIGSDLVRERTGLEMKDCNKVFFEAEVVSFGEPPNCGVRLPAILAFYIAAMTSSSVESGCSATRPSRNSA